LKIIATERLLLSGVECSQVSEGTLAIIQQIYLRSEPVVVGRQASSEPSISLDPGLAIQVREGLFHEVHFERWGLSSSWTSELRQPNGEVIFLQRFEVGGELGEIASVNVGGKEIDLTALAASEEGIEPRDRAPCSSETRHSWIWSTGGSSGRSNLHASLFGNGSNLWPHLDGVGRKYVGLSLEVRLVER